MMLLPAAPGHIPTSVDVQPCGLEHDLNAGANASHGGLSDLDWF